VPQGPLFLSCPTALPAPGLPPQPTPSREHRPFRDRTSTSGVLLLFFFPPSDSAPKVPERLSNLILGPLSPVGLLLSNPPEDFPDLSLSSSPPLRWTFEDIFPLILGGLFRGLPPRCVLFLNNSTPAHPPEFRPPPFFRCKYIPPLKNLLMFNRPWKVTWSPLASPSDRVASF